MSMNIFFTASLRGKERYLSNYKKIFDELSKKNQVFAEHVFNIDLKQVSLWEPEYRFDYYIEILNRIKDCDCFVVDLTAHSVNVEYEVSMAISLKKNIIIFHLANVDIKNNSTLSIPENDDRIQILPYTNTTIEKVVKFAIVNVKNNINKRFTILLPTHIVNFLEKTSRDSSVPISVYLRALIEKQMKVD